MFVAERRGVFIPAVALPLQLHRQVPTRESEDAYKTPPRVPGLPDMAARSLIAFAVVVAVQALAGCDMPAKSGVTRDDHSAWRKAASEVRDARLRRQVEAGTFGLAQLFPDGMPVDPRHLRPLPPPRAVPMPVVPARVAHSSASEAPVRVAFATSRGQPCVFKPVMSDADIDACR
jgi:hypothetical protein